MKKRSLFLDERMVEASEELEVSLAPGVVRGKGVFETMRLRWGKILDLDDHLTRLLNGLKTLRIRAPYSRAALSDRLKRVARANHLSDARMRLAVWREGRRLRIAIVGKPFKGYSKEQYARGFKAVLSKVRRVKSRFSHIKSMDYGCFRRAFMEAEKLGYDEAILLNKRDELVEGSRTNIFLVRKGVLYTPAARCGCLNGITRKKILQLARRLNISYGMVTAGTRVLRQADEAFLTNSLMGVMPLTSLNGRSIGRQRGAGPLTKKLADAYDTNTHSSCPVKGKSV